MNLSTDIVIIGSGIIGLALARELNQRNPSTKIILLEKEKQLARHASGRNSGVLHAGFYYTSDSLKAKLTAEGNRVLTDYCVNNGLAINRCGKVVVAKNEAEIKILDELKRRGDANGVILQVIDEKELGVIEPNAKTYHKALFSPHTSTIDPLELMQHIASHLGKNVSIRLGEKYLKKKKASEVQTTHSVIGYQHLINAAGLYADWVAHQFDVGKNYTLLPFKGLYHAYNDTGLLKRHVYPVPDLGNPFLGVHFTLTVDGHIKAGPTAMPAIWRENYGGLTGFRPKELAQILMYEGRLYTKNVGNFRKLAFEELKKRNKKHFIHQASQLVKQIDKKKFGNQLKAGIRAQLLDKTNLKLVQDFMVQKGENSTHILNAVSPGLTCSFSFAKYVVDRFVTDQALQ